MSRLRYDLRCNKCGASPIRVKNIVKKPGCSSRHKNVGTFYICTTKCGRLKAGGFSEIK